ncbi:hypothetical protein TNCV_1292171 [Trichonephila clavipes]|nr:hypothetical protein TNCV_1292171 [Trichonephila clavipes]
MDSCKCRGHVRQEITLNSHATSGGLRKKKRGGRLLTNSKVFSLKIGKQFSTQHILDAVGLMRAKSLMAQSPAICVMWKLGKGVPTLWCRPFHLPKVQNYEVRHQ